jgi:hypothetical protein
VRLEPLTVFRWSYDAGARIGAPGYAIVSPYGSDEGIGYGEGHGTATGLVEGSVVWANYPRRRSDGRMLPDVRGLITTTDGASSCGGGRSSRATSRGGRTSSVGSSRITSATAG